MTEEEVLAAGKTFSLGTPEVARRRAGVKAARNADGTPAASKSSSIMQSLSRMTKLRLVELA